MVVILVSTAVVWLPVGREKIYENYDGPYYVAVARSWYNKEILGRNFSFPIPLEYYAAHFPLYPALINAISAFGLNRLQAMLAVNLAATAAAAMVIYKVVEVQKWGNPLWVALAWLFVWTFDNRQLIFFPKKEILAGGNFRKPGSEHQKSGDLAVSGIHIMVG